MTDSNQLKPPYTLILDELCKGKVIPFLGAGASLGNRPPRFRMGKRQVLTLSQDD